jgi:hypothetical protein
VKKKISIVLLSLLLFLLAGCVKADIGVKVNKDGTADATFLFAVEKQMYSMMKGTADDPLPDMKSEMESEGFTVEDYEDEEYTGYKGTNTFESFEELSVDFADTDAPFSFEKEEGFFSTKYVVKGSFEGEENVPDEEKMFYNQFDLNFNLELPGTIGEHNADSVEGNQMSWELSLIETTDIHAESSSVNTGAIILIIAIAVVVIGGLLFFILKRKKPQQNNATDFNNHVNQDNGFEQKNNDDNDRL